MLKMKNKTEVVKNNTNQADGNAAQKKSSAHAEISKKAYELFKKRGSKDCLDQKDWFEAEKCCKVN